MAEVVPLYDVEEALRQMARQRRKRDPLSVAQAQLGDKLAANMVRHFGPEAVETAGLSLVIGGASVVALKDLDPAILCNVLAYAGQRLVVDARAGDEAAREEIRRT